MDGTDLKRPVSVTAMEQWPWPMRALLGCLTACAAIALTCLIKPLNAFPLLLAFPMVVLVCWFLGMWGGVICALTDTILVDLFLTRTEVRLAIGSVREELRLSVFLLVSLFLGWAIRRLAQQRALLATQELQRQLAVADTERRLAQERAHASEALRDRDDVLQIALSSNGMGLWMWDLKENSIQWSDEVYRIVGREPGSVEPASEAWLQLVLPDDVDRLRDAIRRTREDGAEYHQQYRVVWPDGSIRWVESQGRCQRSAEGQVIRVVGVLSDITSRKQSEEAMLRAEKLAVAGRLAASVAHEINNPLEAVANLLYLIAHAETTESAHLQAEQALDELMRVSLITQQTLKFHRQAGTPKVTRLSELVQTVLALFRGKLLTAQITADVRAEREVSIACMPGEVQQILANLISNAIDSMPRGGRLLIRLRPSCDWRDRTTRGMRITLCDAGAGMNPATMRRIFEPFFTTKLDTGTGLGLWVVAQLVERHRGHVRVWSTQRPGASATIVSVFLPLGESIEPDPQSVPVAQAIA